MYDRETGRLAQYGLPQQVVIEKKNWPTPMLGEAHLTVSKKAAENREKEGKVNLTRQVQLGNWPTPNVPTGGPKKDGSAPPGLNGGKGHREMMQGVLDPKKKLNPRWVEMLMGLSVGWCMPSCKKLNDPEIFEQSDNRIDELRLLGNGVVPATVSKAFIILIQEASNDNRI